MTNDKGLRARNHHNVSWRSPPSRRELTLFLFSLTVFILFYNLDTSFRLLGLDPIATQSALMGKLGFRKGIIGTDGRRPPGWRDLLEMEIFGEWGWEEGHVAKGGAIWLGKAQTGAGEKQEIFGEGTANDVFMHWGDQVPKTRLVKHVPGTFQDWTHLMAFQCSFRIHNSRFCNAAQWNGLPRDR
jgi:hypothetical protein